eukprot:4718539-Heterocapsa_arctica.AAC.1
MENGKDKRADKPCDFLAAGHCKLGDNCPCNHTMKPGKGVEAAAAPNGDTTTSGQPQICRLFLET